MFTWSCNVGSVLLFGCLFVLFVSCLCSVYALFICMTRVIHMPARHHVYIVQGLIRGTFTVLSPAHPLVLVLQVPIQTAVNCQRVRRGCMTRA
jgi:hypothetical protein